MSIFKLSGVSSLQLFQLIRYGTTVSVAVLLVKLGANQEQIAVYETFLWLTGMFSFFWVAGTINGMLSLKAEYNEREVFSNTAAMMLWQSVIATQCLVTYQFFTNGYPILTALAAGYLLFNTTAFLIEYICYLKGMKKLLLSYAFAAMGIQFLFTLIPFLITGETLWAVAGMSVLGIAKLIFLIGLLRKYAIFSFNKKYIAQLIKVSLPITFGVFASGIAEYIDGFLVKHFFDENSFTVFRYGSRELPIALILANTLSTSMIAPLANNLRSGLSELKLRTQKLAVWLFPTASLLMLLSKPMFVFFYNESYVASAAIFNMLLLLVIPRLLFPQTILTALRLNRFTLFSALIEVGINIAASLILMQHFGLMGIALGTVVAFGVDKLFLMFALYRARGIKPTEYIPLKSFLIGSAILLTAFLLSSSLYFGNVLQRIEQPTIFRLVSNSDAQTILAKQNLAAVANNNSLLN